MTGRSDRRPGTADRRPRTVSFALDDRARVPFAVIGALLLISAVTIVGVLESRPEPEIDRDAELAMDRADGAATVELRHAALRAFDRAARDPVTKAASTPVGRAVDDGDETFDRYVELLIYREALASIDGTTVDVADDTATISLDPVDWTDEGEVADAVDRVRIDEIDDGVVEVELRDVEVTHERRGRERTERRNVTVAVATPLFELHEKTETYEERLSGGFFESNPLNMETFGQEFGARMLAFAWGQSYYDRLAGSPPPNRTFENITPNEHSEVLANDAVFAVQEDVFDTSDPYSDRVMRGPTVLMAQDLAQEADLIDFDLQEILEDLAADTPGIDPDNVSDEQLIEYLFGDVEGGLEEPIDEDEVPSSVAEILEVLVGEVDMQTVEFHALPFAEFAYVETTLDYNTGDDMEAVFNQSLAESSNLADYNLGEHYGDDPVDQDADIGDFDDIDDAITDLVEEDIDDEDLIGGIIDDVYQVNVQASFSSSDPDWPDTTEGPPSDGDSSNWTIEDSWHDTRRWSASVDDSDDTESPNSFDDVDLATLDLEYSGEVDYVSEWVYKGNTSNLDGSSTRTLSPGYEEVTHEGTITITGDLATQISDERRDGFDIDTAFDPGGDQHYDGYEPLADVDVFATTPANFEDADEEAIDAILVDAGSAGDLESEIGGLDPEDVRDDGLEDLVRYNYHASVDDFEPADQNELEAWLEAELAQTHLQLVTTVPPGEAELQELFVGDSPIWELQDHVDAETHLIEQNVSGNSYDNLPDLARTETRQVYFDQIGTRIDDVATIHEDANDEANNLVGDLMGGAIDDADTIIGDVIGFLSKITSAPQVFFAADVDDELGTLDGSDVLEDTHVQVDGSPTYLPIETVDRDEVAAVRPADARPTDVDPRTTHAPMAAAYENFAGYPGVPLIPWPSLYYVQLDIWTTEVKGEYARFEVQATSGSATDADATTYVREAKPVHLELNGTEETVGTVEPLGFENAVSIPVVAPSPLLYQRGSLGIGNSPGIDDDESPTWDELGPDVE